jgi:hypothetical protein
MHCDFRRIHKKLREIPEIGAALADRLWGINKADPGGWRATRE